MVKLYEYRYRAQDIGSNKPCQMQRRNRSILHVMIVASRYVKIALGTAVLMMDRHANVYTVVVSVEDVFVVHALRIT